MKWDAIIAEIDAPKYKQLLNDIHTTLISGFHDAEMNKSDVMYGAAGFVLYHTGIKYSNILDIDNAEQLDKAIEKALELVTTAPDDNLSLGQGIAGIAWLFQHLITKNVIDAEFDALFSEIIAELKNYSLGCLTDRDYDYLLGGLGYVLVILETVNENEGHFIYVKRIVELLIHISTNIDEEKIAWVLVKDLRSFETNNIVYNLGISHGNPSIILILSLIYEKYQDLRSTIKPIVEKSIAWILSTKFSEGKSNYTYSIIENEEKGPSSLRWCYGDLGVAVCLYLTGKRFNNMQWQNEGVSTMLHSAERIYNEVDGIPDAHICHGTAGIGHVFNRFYNYTQLKEFKEAAIFCFEETYKRATYNENGQVLFYADKGGFGMVPFGGLMEGSIGISLILMSAITDIEPQWDRLFLLS